MRMTGIGVLAAGVLICLGAASAADLARAMGAALGAPVEPSAGTDPDGIEAVLQVYASLARQVTPLAA